MKGFKFHHELFVQWLIDVWLSTFQQMRHLRRKCGKEMQRLELVAEEHCNRANRISEELNQMRADYMEVKREVGINY